MFYRRVRKFLCGVYTGIAPLMRIFSRAYRNPTFAVIFIITLALGVGANIALFSALRGYFLSPLPYKQSSRLIVISQSIAGHNNLVSDSTYNYLKKQAQTIKKGGLAYEGEGIVHVGNAMPRPVNTAMVTSSLFSALGVHAFIGSLFSAASDKPGASKKVVVSYRYWKSALNADANVVGETLKLNAERYVITGVMPKGFYFPNRRDVMWIPIILSQHDLSPNSLFHMSGQRFVARLMPGVSRLAAERELTGLAMRQVAKLPPGAMVYAKHNGYKIVTSSLRDSLIGTVGTRLILIEIGAGLLLVLTAAILGNLVIVRTIVRSREMALRIALGGNSFSLWKTAASETIPLGLVSGAIGLAIAWGGSALISRYGIGTSATAFSVTPSFWGVVLGILLGLVVGAIAALPVVLYPKEILSRRLFTGGRDGVSPWVRRMQRTLSVAQIGISAALILNAIILTVVFWKISTRPTGLDSHNLVVADLGLHGSRFKTSTQQIAFYSELGDAVRALPGINQAGVASVLPFSGGQSVVSVTAEDSRVGKYGVNSFISFVDGRTLNVLGMRLVTGRLLSRADIEAGSHVAVIDSTLARELYGSTEVVGKQITIGKGYRIIGVVSPILWNAQEAKSSTGVMWIPYTAAAPTFTIHPEINLAVRSTLPLNSLRRELNRVLQRLGPEQAFSYIAPMALREGVGYRSDEAAPVLFLIFGLLALLLTIVGIYGTVSYLTERRLAEFAVRQALGATPHEVALQTIMQGVLLAIPGILLGLGLGYVVTRVLFHYIGASVVDIGRAFIVTIVVLGVSVIISSLIPAYRVRRASLTSLLKQ